MIVNISWISFQQRFMRTAEIVFVKEHNDKWVTYANQGPIIVKCEVMKSEEPEQNMAFVDRHFNEANICKVDFVDENLKVNFSLVQQ